MIIRALPYQELLQQARPIAAEKIQALVHRVDGLHLGPLLPLDIEPAALSIRCNSDLAIFLDVQGYTRMIRDRLVMMDFGLQNADFVSVVGMC